MWSDGSWNGLLPTPWLALNFALPRAAHSWLPLRSLAVFSFWYLFCLFRDDCRPRWILASRCQTWCAWSGADHWLDEASRWGSFSPSPETLFMLHLCLCCPWSVWSYKHRYSPYSMSGSINEMCRHWRLRQRWLRATTFETVCVKTSCGLIRSLGLGLFDSWVLGHWESLPQVCLWFSIRVCICSPSDDLR